MSEDLITKITRIFPQEDGSEVKVVAERYGLAGTDGNVGFDVFHRESKDKRWRLCGDQKDAEWRKMSVQEYIERGRPEFLRYVSWAQIMQVSSYIGKPMSVLEDSKDPEGMAVNAESANQEGDEPSLEGPAF